MGDAAIRGEDVRGRGNGGGGGRVASLLAPGRCVVVTVELQVGVVGDGAMFPALVEAVRDGHVVEHAAQVCDAARAAGVPVVHAVVAERADGAGQSANTKIGALVRKQRQRYGAGATDEGQPGVALVPQLGPAPSDVVASRIHGLTPFTSTSLDQVIRNLATEFPITVVLMGVSLNVGVLGAALSAADLGYHVVLVRDAVAGVPTGYAEAVLAHTLSMVATLATSAEVVARWSPGAEGGDA